MGDAQTLGGAMGDILFSTAKIAFTWVPTTAISLLKGIPMPDASDPAAPSGVVSYVYQSSDPTLYESLFSHWALFVSLSIVTSILFGALIIYCVVRILEIRRHEWQQRATLVHTVAAHNISKTQLRWNRVVEQAYGNDEQHWRLAILEADIMLGELLDVRGYRGETLGDKMKQVNRADFNSIDLAWEAHKVRNAIAHQGSARLLNEREVRRVIGLYEQVFREFGFVE